jgi:hypothetical protein
VVPTFGLPVALPVVLDSPPHPPARSTARAIGTSVLRIARRYP